MPNLAEAFKKAMNTTGLKSISLAEAAGRSQNNISEIRLGKVSPNIKDFGELLDLCENLRPGFLRAFAVELLGGELVSEEAIAHLPPEKKARILQAVANSLTKSKNGKTVLSR